MFQPSPPLEADGWVLVEVRDGDKGKAKAQQQGHPEVQQVILGVDPIHPIPPNSATEFGPITWLAGQEPKRQRR